MVSARSAFPYQLRVPSSLSRALQVGIPPLEVPPEDLLPEAASDRAGERGRDRGL